jgi:MFS family permease
VRAPGVARTLALALLARVPPPALGLLLVLQIRHLGHSYALAGVCSGAFALGEAVCSPLLGRTIDRTGQRAVVAFTGVVAAVACVVFAFIPAGAPAGLLIAVAAAMGAVQPPLVACVRVIWRRILDREGFNRLVTLDASLQELAFMAGPLVLISLASATSPAVALATTGALLGACSLVFAGLRETRRFGGPQHDHGLDGPRPAGGALSAPAVRVLLVVAALLGVAFGATELSLVTAAAHLDARSATGVLFALWCVGSFLSGALWAHKRAADADPVRSMFWLILACGVPSLPLGLAPSVALLGVGLVIAGAAIAPMFGVLYSLMADVTPPGTLTEALTLQSSALTAGLAVGSASAGAVASGVGAPATFVLAGVAYIAAGLAVRARSADLRAAT